VKSGVFVDLPVFEIDELLGQSFFRVVLPTDSPQQVL